jgi:hypothetical protein
MTFDHRCAHIRAVTTIKPPHPHVCEDWIKRSVGASADVPGVWTDIVLR